MSLPIFTSTTTAEEVAAVLSQKIKGRNVLITGPTIGGIGFETARVLAKYAALVILAGYNLERLKLAEDEIKTEAPSATLRTVKLDLSSLSSVRAAAEEVNAYPEPLHVLINNAATAAMIFKLSPDNLEMGMATNHIGPFLLTNLLVPKLLASSTEGCIPRVVFVSSTAHAGQPQLDVTALANSDPAKHIPMLAYRHSKAANILTAIELSKRSNGKVKAYSLHPGVIFTNGLKAKENRRGLIAAGILTNEGLPNTEKLRGWKTLAQGAATTIAAAFDPRLEASPGAYLCDGMEANDKVAPHASDPGTAAALWAATEEIVGEKFML
ncbi:Short-chain dehydrogenase/reductase family protein [Mycena venus]|uniref:Short-chain dehydrogenase/reductase family protein n=1 Tax=Mycena venus TaxID=2733690 RepID=A0A8H7D120_9AGAR|nr:Short-chain dehydrogenase/reductase family protein [Mycena venus]